jgi:YesN/AraC family two-component response regulator
MEREKILVVDDEKVIREIFINAFSEYNVITAATGGEALTILSRPNDIDLVVLDVMMPDVKGTELLREVKRINSDYKVIILTGFSSKEVAVEALRSDADEYIEKPFDIEEVKDIFQRLLGRNSFIEEGVGNIEEKIIRAQRFIKRNYNKPIHLIDVSQEIFLSPKYFSRIFKGKTGRSFNEYRLELRIEIAKQFLERGSHTVSQIAYKVGYQNPDSFMKMFKQCTGFTPSQYRMRSRSRREKGLSRKIWNREKIAMLSHS